MNHTQRGILNLIRSAITGKAHPLPEDFQLAEAEDLIVKHQIVGLAYEGAVCCGIPKTDPTMGKLFQIYYQRMIHSHGQMAALKKLFAAFDENGIDYLPVKGYVLKSLYPQPAMRIMGDADVLIRVEQQEIIRPIMESLGYTEGKGDTNEWVWHSKQLHLELHTSLVPAVLTLEYNYFKNIWQSAKKTQGHRYELSCERSYVFLFFHYAKHYRNGGIGLRQLTDLWIWQQRYPKMNMDKVYRGLDKLKLVPFYENTQRMLSVWFDQREPDEKSLFMSDYIFSSGSWGTHETHMVSTAVRKAQKAGSIQKGRTETVFTAVFPSAEQMALQFPVLKKCPWLLPVFWPVRWIRTLLFRRKSLQRYQADILSISAEKIETFQQAIQYVGLDYHS